MRAASRVAEIGRERPLRRAPRSRSRRSASQRAATASPPSAPARAHRSARCAPAVSGRAGCPRRPRARRRRAAAGRRADRSFQKSPMRASQRRAAGSPASRARACRPRRAGAGSRPAPCFSSCVASASQPGGWQPPRKPIAIRPSSQSGIVSVGECARCRRVSKSATIGASRPLALWIERMRTVSGSPGRVAGRSGSSRAVAMRSSSRFAKPRRVSAPELARRLARQGHHLLEVRDLRLAAARAGERGQDARLVVEPLEQRGDASPWRRSLVQLVEQAQRGAERRGARLLLVHRAEPERPARERVGHDVAVAHAEERRAQRGHQRDAVRRVVDRAQDARASRAPPGGRRTTCRPRR